MRSRLLFVKDATVSGWGWLVEVNNHVGLALAILLLLGVSAASYTVLPHTWWAIVAYVVALWILLFVEGAYRGYGELLKKLPAEGLPIQEVNAISNIIQNSHTLEERWLQGVPVHSAVEQADKDFAAWCDSVLMLFARLSLHSFDLRSSRRSHLCGMR